MVILHKGEYDMEHKTKLNITLKALLCIFCIAALSIMPPLQVRAESIVSAIVDSISTGGRGGDSKVQNGISQNRTGYMVYLLDMNGNKPTGSNGTPQAYALAPSSSSNWLGGGWKCQSRLGGYTVNGWTPMQDGLWWNMRPWHVDTDGGPVESYEPNIKAWMIKDNTAGTKNAVEFVQQLWNDSSLTEQFRNNEIVLCIETILNLQFSVSEEGMTREDAAKLVDAEMQNIKGKSFEGIMLYIGSKDWPDNGLSVKYTGLVARYATWKNDKKKEGLTKKIEKEYNAIKSNACALVNELRGPAIAALMEKGGSGSHYELKGSPIYGTLPCLIEYKQSLGLSKTSVDSYVNNKACFAEYITVGGIGEKVGFKAWPGTPQKLTDSQVKEYGVGLIVVQADTPGVIHTWDSPLDVPGPAPDHPFKKVPPQLSIVKNYRTKNMETGEYTDDGCFIRRDVVPDISIDDEPEYKVVGWKVSTTTQDNIDSIDWNPPGTISKNGLTSGSTKLEEQQNEYCLYVLLEKSDEEPPEEEDYNYLLPQSRITRRIWLSTPDNPLPEKIDTHEFIWSIEEHIHECAGHYCDGLNSFHSCDGHEKEISETETITEHCPTGCKDEAHDDYCDERSGVSPWKFMERNLKLSIYNTEKENYPDIVSVKKEWTENTGEVKPVNGLMKSFYDNGSFDRGDSEYDYTAKEYKETGWDYICVIHRGQDDLTLLEYKNDLLGASDANTELVDVSPKSYQVSNTDSGTRKTGDYYEAFNAVFELDTKTPGVDNETTFGPVDRSPHVGGICAMDLKRVILDPLSINDIKVKVEVYSGLASGGQNDITPNLPQRGNEGYNYKGTTYDKSRRVKIETGGSVSFRPYIQMQYDTILNIDKKAYVIGEYQRSITTNDYAEIGYNSGTGGILTLSSLQWSTHKSSQGNGKVLPGGAALSLSIDTGNHRFVRISTFQCFIDGAGKEQIDKIGGDYSALQTQSEAKGSHDSLVASVKAAIEVLNVQQWVNRNGGDPFGGIPVDNYENMDISALDNNAKDGKVSMDAKYYFSNDGGNTLAGEGDLDVEIAGQDSEIVYTFFTNTKGEVRVVKDDVNAPLVNEDAGTVLCTITKDMENWDYGNAFTGGSNLTADAAYINQRTNVVDKLIKGVEAGTGRDTGIGMTNAPGWRNPEWYNEAFDGISVVVNSTVLEVGYKYPSERQIVLDPKLIPYQKNQASMATNLTFTSGFKTKPYSPAYKSVPGQIGQFRGARIDLADMDTFFKTSESFHILNQTTQDLH